MARGKETITAKKNISFILILIVFASLYPVIVYAQSTSIVIPSVRGAGPVTSPFGRRVAPKSGASTNHRGVDYGTPSNTKLTTNAPVTRCSYRGKAGNVADVIRTCADGTQVMERYFHLATCNGVTGSSTVTTDSTGNVTGPHLHYEILIAGSHVDPHPQAAFGKNLCDPQVRSQLLNDAKNKGIAGGGGGATAPSNPTTGGGGGGGGSPPPSAPNPYNPPPPQDHMPPATLPPTTDQVVPTTTTNNEVTGCAVDTWQAMVNQSVLQTRREMLMNERYIAKADSVLAYSCFQEFYANVPNLGIFSEAQIWNNAQVDILGRFVTLNIDMGSSSLESAIANAVDSAVEAYLDDNFNHDFLGGLLSGPLPASSTPSSTGVDDDGVSQYGFGCGRMRQVWDWAKCHNVTDDPMFYTFEALINYDPRIYPHEYACNDSGIFQTMIDKAHGLSTKFDVVTTYLDTIWPNTGQCAPPIPTGVKVTRRTGTGRITNEITYDDGLCITAGCSYQNSGSGAGSCVFK